VPHLPPISALAILWAVLELVLAIARYQRSSGPSRDRRSLALIWLVCALAATFGVRLASQRPGWRLPATATLHAATYVFFGGGLALRTYAIICLGRFFSPNVAIQRDHRLIVSGPYRLIRHPTYTGSLLALTGIALTLHNLLALFVIVAPVVAVLAWRIHVEEAVLVDAFGDEYRRYMARAKRLVPYVY
jgi:protein-S-isoprenylcysteine O-methyltransferase